MISAAVSKQIRPLRPDLEQEVPRVRNRVARSCPDRACATHSANCASESDLRVFSAPNTPLARIRPNHIRPRIRPNSRVRRPPVALCRPELASR